MDLDADPKQAWFESARAAHGYVRSGDCARALKTYANLAQESQRAWSTREELARVYAGMGVCHERNGEMQRAQFAFQRAEKLSPSVDAWVSQLRDSLK